MTLDKITSAIINDVQSGVSGISANPTLVYEQIADEVVEMRSAVIKEFWLKGILRKSDLQLAINCLSVDCADQNKCCTSDIPAKAALHCEIPQLMDGLGRDAITYIGSTDRSFPFDVYFSKDAAKSHAYKRRGKERPYVYIERTPNVNGMYDCWIYNAPFVETIAIIGIFKDPRQLEEFQCCNQEEYLDLGTISTEIKNRLVEKKMRLYRQYLMPPHQTDLSPR